MKTKITQGVFVLLIVIQSIPLKKNQGAHTYSDINRHYNLNEESEVIFILSKSCYNFHSN
jgi:hypothetical protein